MKRIHHYTILLLSAFILLMSSCMPERSEIWIEKDGGGKMEVTMDMGEMASMAGSIIGSLDEGNSDAGPKDMWENEENIDTVMNFYDMMPDSIRQKIDNPEVLRNMLMSLKVNAEKEEAKFKLATHYKDEKERTELFHAVTQMQEQKAGGAMAMAGDDMDLNSYFGGWDADIKNGIIRIKGASKEDLKDPEMEAMIKELENPEKAEDPEFIEFMKMMFGGKLTTVVHAPGKIEFTNDMHAIISGNTVTFEDDMMQVLKGEGFGDRLIKFKH